MTLLSYYAPGSVGTAGDGFRVPPPRKGACQKHRVWMAACPDCRDAHRPVPLPRTAPDNHTPTNGEQR